MELLQLPRELITDHITIPLDYATIINLSLVCKLLYNYLFNTICAFRNSDYEPLLYNKLITAIKFGNTRAIAVIINNPVMKLYNRRQISPTSLFNEYCGLSYQSVKYTRALKLINNITDDAIKFNKILYNILVWTAKSEKQELFEIILTKVKKCCSVGITDIIGAIFEDLLTTLISLESPIYVDKLLDHFNNFKTLSNVQWKCSHVNTKAVILLVNKLKPVITLNENIYQPSSEDNGEKMNVVLGIIWPYCRIRQIDLEDAVKYSIRGLNASYMEFVAQKLSHREITLIKPYKPNSMLIKLVNASGYNQLAVALQRLKQTLDSVN
ncbi:Hypothetical protein FSTVST1_309 [Faustovirus ST1]|nr:Hypothetical protein FSTVST1_309 [Faustovirus ST1]